MKMGVTILGTSAENVDAAEDRELFDEILEQCRYPETSRDRQYLPLKRQRSSKRAWLSCTGSSFLRTWWTGYADRINDDDVEEFIGIINQIAQEHPILVDKYLMGKEIEVDAVCDGRYPDSWYHGTYRACRNPLRRQYLRISGTDHQQKKQKILWQSIHKRLARHCMLSV